MAAPTPRKFTKGQRVRYVGPYAYSGAEGTVDQPTSPTRFRVFLTRPDGSVFGTTARAEDLEAI